MAQWLEKKIDWQKESRWLMEQGITLADVMANTPHQIYLMFFKPVGVAVGKRIDAVGELIEVNRKRAEQGLRPTLPSWFWKG